MHSSYRSTFRTLSDIPLGKIDETGVTPFRADYKRRREDHDITLKAVFDDRVSLVYYYPRHETLHHRQSVWTTATRAS